MAPRRQLGEITGNSNNAPVAYIQSSLTSKIIEQSLSPKKKTKSTRNLRGLFDKDCDNSKSDPSARSVNLKRPKSSTSLHGLFTRPTSAKEKLRLEPEVVPQNEGCETQYTPIWAQFATIPLSVSDTTIAQDTLTSTPHTITKQPLAEPSDSTTPSFQKTQTFASRTKRAISRVRPKSECVDVLQSPVKKAAVSGHIRSKSEVRKDAPTALTRVPSTGRGSRVLDKVASINARTKSKVSSSDQLKLETVLPTTPAEIENAFEKLLESRNIPPSTRDKMLALDQIIKLDLIKQSLLNVQASSPVLVATTSNKQTASQNRTPTFSKATKRPGSSSGPTLLTEAQECARALDQSRESTSPSKKRKPDISSATSYLRSRSRSRETSRENDVQSSRKARSRSQGRSAGGILSKVTPTNTSKGLISYLQKNQKPQTVEVGKIQKLRQLLRNESVDWVNSFIEEGGINEVVDLFYRIVDTEWREEHEDALLHETLLCLKALSTTSLGMRKLSSLQSKLFPTMLGQLFSTEKKGPSDFSTRMIMINLLFAYLCSAPEPDIQTRSQILLNHLRDPDVPETEQLPAFITTMHRPRPYRVWQKEITNVTKEVFWIFLHHVNVIPIPKYDTDLTTTDYQTRHFPQPHLPVPLAPYVGGVEWEAMTYITAHLDLLNGIIAAIPTRAARNALRQEMMDSGFEKVIGGSVRTCKEKFYQHVHTAMTTWIGAAKEDGWDVRGVREGTFPKTAPSSPVKVRTGGAVKQVKGGPPLLCLDLNLDTKEVSGSVDTGLDWI